ncbi:stage V sporulation protein S [Streptomyces sp. UNOC14_S4]|uniref:stage V sporulation protein S n=1 Tax=Streptomyces sp. UNOC14_S4 TaxID=2872340 RepID=UPI001E44A718|nr:stage V sporulation protein S [Streptomyces sp. UNOC14_S4]MCC3766015.1 stage V sporulation protein S [Streptomyces sp. UNOC14_S4]
MKNHAPEEITLLVKSSTSATSLGSMLARCIYEGKRVSLRAIGASAVNQAAKSIPIAQGHAAPKGHQLAVNISFFDSDIQGQTKTGLQFRITDTAR